MAPSTVPLERRQQSFSEWCCQHLDWDFNQPFSDELWLKFPPKSKDKTRKQKVLLEKKSIYKVEIIQRQSNFIQVFVGLNCVGNTSMLLDKKITDFYYIYLTYNSWLKR